MAISIPNNLIQLIPHKSQVTIPKIIHQTYKSLEQLPEIWKSTPDEWKKHHPDWKYMFWSDHDCRQLVKKYFPWFLPTFDGYEYNIQRADAIRPILMYVYGGIYADMDIQPTKSFDDLFYQDTDIYLIRTSNGNVVTNCMMASKAGVIFWKYIIEEMKIRMENPSILWIGKHIKTMMTTGPLLVNFIFNEYQDNFNIKFLPQELILPTTCGTCSEKPCIVPFGYTRLLEGSSWVEFDTRIFNFINCNYDRLLILITSIMILYNILLASNSL